MAKGKLTMDEKEHYEYLKELHAMLCSEMKQLQEDHRQAQKELNYLRSFVRYKHLENEYNHFFENAYELEEEDLPFSHYTL